MREKGVYGKAAFTYYRMGLVVCLMGLMFVVWSAVGNGGLFSAVFGLLSLVYGLVHIYSGWKLRKPN